MLEKKRRVQLKRKMVSIYLVLALLVGMSFSFVPQTAIAANEIYKDPAQSVEARVADLLSRMTLDEKVGQMIQAERSNASYSDMQTYMLGSILNGGGNIPSPNNPTTMCDMVDNYQKAAICTRLQIPFIYGIDAVHGNNNIYGATVFPHNIGLGATRDADLVKRIGSVVAEEVKATGVQWTFAPCIAVVQNVRWGRSYESFSENTDVVSELGVAATKGFQGDNYSTDLKSTNKIAVCMKHYIGDGATKDGINEGELTVSETELRQKYLPPYIEAIKAGARTLMASYNTINGVECHMNTRILTDILKNELKFDGFVVTDYNGIDDNDKTNYENAVKLAVNAGIDMFMVSSKWKQVITSIKNQVATGGIKQSRVDDAVTRILRVKFQLGLFENPYTNRSLMSTFGSQEHRAVAREAVRKSLVLLKNDNAILPLSKTGKKIFIAGKNADDIGNQCGGWTISWQGISGNITQGTTILQGIKNAAPGATVTYNRQGTGASGNDVAIVVVGETPYAETKGDRTDLSLDWEDLNTINNVKASGVPMVIVLVSGRPMIVTDQIKNCSAFVAAWLPGTEGSGVADCLFGDYDFTGKLSVTWPVSTSQLPIVQGDGKVPLFPYGFGLSAKGTVSPTPTATPTMTPTATPTPTISSDQPEFKVETNFSAPRLVSNQMITAKVAVTNQSPAYYEGLKDVLLIVALYDSNNTMMNVSYVSKGIAYRVQETLSSGFKLPLNVTGYKVKSFVWDGTSLKDTNMTPLSNEVVLQ